MPAYEKPPALIMAAFMYAQCWLAEKCFMLDFRFIWPFFKTFSLTRLGQFGVYILVFLVFFLLNNSKIFAQNQPVGASLPGFGNFMKCWVKNALCMIGGVLLLIVLEYTPFFWVLARALICGSILPSAVHSCH